MNTPNYFLYWSDDVSRTKHWFYQAVDKSTAKELCKRLNHRVSRTIDFVSGSELTDDDRERLIDLVDILESNSSTGESSSNQNTALNQKLFRAARQLEQRLTMADQSSLYVAPGGFEAMSTDLTHVVFSHPPASGVQESEMIFVNISPPTPAVSVSAKDEDVTEATKELGLHSPTDGHLNEVKRHHAEHYSSKYGIPAGRLDAARRDKRLKNSIKLNGRWQYDDAEVRKTWPDEFSGQI